MNFLTSSLQRVNRPLTHNLARPVRPVRSIYPTRSVPRRNFLTIIPQYERGVRFNFGKYAATCQPGLRLDIPLFHTIHHVDMRDQVQYLSQQEIISKDNVSCKVDAAIQYKVLDAAKSVINVQSLEHSLLELAQLSIREVLGGLTIDELLHNREDLSNVLRNRLKTVSDNWGVEVHAVQLKDVCFEECMKRAMAMTAEAERTAQSKLIHASADIEVAKKYSVAAEIYAENPVTLKLREFQLWQSVAKEPNNFLAVIPSTILDMVKGRT